MRYQAPAIQTAAAARPAVSETIIRAPGHFVAADARVLRYLQRKAAEHRAELGAWRVEFHECGWSSRWYVVRGYHDSTEYLRARSDDWRDGMIRDFTSESDAADAADAAERAAKGGRS